MGRLAHVFALVAALLVTAWFTLHLVPLVLSDPVAAKLVDQLFLNARQAEITGLVSAGLFAAVGVAALLVHAVFRRIVDQLVP